MLTRSAIMQRMRLLILIRATSQLQNKFKEGLGGSKVKTNNNLL
jgi:hypothetical protein